MKFMDSRILTERSIKLSIYTDTHRQALIYTDIAKKIIEHICSWVSCILAFFANFRSLYHCLNHNDVTRLWLISHSFN